MCECKCKKEKRSGFLDALLGTDTLYRDYNVAKVINRNQANCDKIFKARQRESFAALAGVQSKYKIPRDEYMELGFAFGLAGINLPPYSEYLMNRATQEYKNMADQREDSYGVNQTGQSNLSGLGIATKTTREMVIDHLNHALKQTQQAYNVAVSAQPLAADIPVFQEIQKLSRQIQDLMQQVNKLRGL